MQQQDYTKPDINNLLVQSLIGPVSEKERALVDAWLKESKDNLRYFDQLKDIYFLGKITKNPSGFNKETSLEKVKSRYYRIKYNEITERKRTLNYRRIVAIAATFVIALGLGFYLKSLVTSHNATVSGLSKVYNEIVAPKGSRSQVKLPDGTIVWLNAGSTLKYPMNFLEGDREVFLSGEAFFDVAKIEKKRFIVKASDLAIKVWGTKFNVKAYPEEKTIETTLVEGSVSIEKLKGSSKIKETYLTPNQTAIFYKADNSHTIIAENSKLNKAVPKSNVTVKEKVNTVLYTSWKDEKWVLEGETLGELAVELERRYNVKIMFENGSIKKYRFNGIFTNETFEQLLEIIKISAPIDYTITNNEVLLKENTNSKSKYDQFLTR